MSKLLIINICGENYQFDPQRFAVEYIGTGETVHFAEGDFFQELFDF